MILDILIEEFEGSLWTAALEGGRLEGLEIDPIYELVRWGAIYYAKVARIDKSMDAAFISLDGDNIGLLYNSDVRIKQKDGTYKKGGSEAIGKILTPGDMIAVQAKTAYMPSIDDDFLSTENKLPQVSMDITLPGRYLIYGGMLQENIISQRIRDKTMRKRLHDMLDGIPDLKGCILRAASADIQTDVLKREGQILKRTWEEVQKFFEGNEPALIMDGPDAIQRTLSDHASDRIERIEVATMDHFELAEEWCTLFAPDLVTKIKPIELADGNEDLALFFERDIMGQIESLSDQYCVLNNGANIIIQNTAALTAIDVNSGEDKRGHLSINIEAAKEICRQMRLRNEGGMIVIDFLRLKSETEKKELLATLNDMAARDPCTLQIHGFTKLGLVELTRKRRTPPLQARFRIFDD